MKVSVIIPVYNTEKYLKKCIESVIHQIYKDIEIILVDDGSTDKSGKLCDEWAKQDNRIKVMHKNNGGLSSARNAGNNIATGDYILYLDSDDYLSRDCINKLVTVCKQTQADICIIQMLYIPEEMNGEVSFKKNYVKIFSSEKAIEASLYQKLYSCCAPAKLYKKSIIDGIEFPVGKLSEDLATCHLFLDRAKKIAYTNAIGYYYRQHSNSIMHIFNTKRMDALEWAHKIEVFCKEKYPNIVAAAECRTFNVAIHLMLELLNSGEWNEKCYKELWQEIKRTRIKIIFSLKTRFREKAAAAISYGGDRLLKYIWNSGFALKHV